MPLIAVILFLGISATTANGQFPRTRRNTASINGATIAYEITGLRGEPIVLIHGYPLNGDLFEQQRRVLSYTNRVITIDLRGFGRSIAPNDQASIDLYADDVLALLDRLGIPQAIIGS